MSDAVLLQQIAKEEHANATGAWDRRMLCSASGLQASRHSCPRLFVRRYKPKMRQVLAERMDAIDPEMSTVPPELDFRVKCSGMQENTVRRSCGRQILWLVLDVTTMNLHMRSIALR